MLSCHDIETLRAQVHQARQQNKRIALVPTMGNLHDGHISLIEVARARADVVIATIFVNPLQFGPNEDLATYPRTLREDTDRLAKAQCDLLFVPDTTTLYPQQTAGMTRVNAGTVAQRLCGANRPGHFDGVVTVVSILFHLVQPDVAIFGEKDFQQLQVIRALVNDLKLPIEIIGAPIIRAADGLALSSRNGYLTAEQRCIAPILNQTLMQVAEQIIKGAPIEETLYTGKAHLTEAGFEVDYLELCDQTTLMPATTTTQASVLLVAASLGSTRLLDNHQLILPT